MVIHVSNFNDAEQVKAEGENGLTVMPEVIAPSKPASTGSASVHILRPTYAPHNPAIK